MSSFMKEIYIEASPETVWAVLADIGSIYRWNPGVESSQLTTEQGTGLGACRHCKLGGKNFLDEEVVLWEEGERLTMRIIGTNLPFKTADIRFALHPEGEDTRVTVSPEYTLKYGPLGKLMDAAFVHRTASQGMEALLVGLKEYIEVKKETP